ncbi:uncharacterized protein LOC113311158 [Papaver somniferum]|uniref:uncharacterized protein LOC113311158 n=1 Tax=Papaver somniferum TaxID=3469 RepID=UPI000E7004C8|nr:uncharacterized protein LOC113311158 [Papaver somniferum]
MEDEGIYSGYKINRWAPSVSHIMFADDVMLFGNTDTKIINSITLVLQQYNHISGQLVNYSKSSIHFSKSVSNTYVEEIIQQLGLLQEEERKFIPCWSYSAHSVSTFTHPSFLHGHENDTKNRLKQVDTDIREFLAGSRQEEEKNASLKLGVVQSAKEKGGLGLRSLYDLNLALVAKLVWRFLKEQDALWAQILRAKYLRDSSFWEVKKITNCSTTWDAMLDNREQRKKCCIWLVGNGQSINIFSDPWVHTLPGFVPEKLVDGNNKHKKHICNNDEESVKQILHHCSFAQAVWFASPLGLRLQESNQLALTSLMESLFSANDNNSSLALGMAICWDIWKCRNAKVFDQKNMNVHDALTIALYWFNIYHNYNGDEELNGMESNHQTAVVPTNVTWTPPDHPTIKINVNAAWRDGAFACAAVARDHTGHCHVLVPAGKIRLSYFCRSYWISSSC